MWRTFKAEFVALWKSRLRFASWMILLFMPLIYGFLFLSSFWSPFKNTDKLPVVVVNLDHNSGESQKLVNSLTNGGEDLVFNGGSSEYKIHVTDAKDLYTSEDQVKTQVDNGKYSAAFVIPDGYQAMANGIKAAVLSDFANNNVDAASLIADINNHVKATGMISFYNSFKMSYVAGEMTNMGSTLYRLLGKIIFPDVSVFENILNDVQKTIPGIVSHIATTQSKSSVNMAKTIINQLDPKIIKGAINVANREIAKVATKLAPVFTLVPQLKTQFESVAQELVQVASLPDSAINQVLVAKITAGLNALNLAIGNLNANELQPLVDAIKAKVLGDMAKGNALVDHRTYGKREGVVGQHDVLNTYGYGLSPYFLSIVLWAGALLMVFLFPNKRYIKTEGTFKNVAGKAAVWIMTGWIQTLLLFAIISIPGIFGTLTFHDVNGHDVVIKQCINLGGGQWKLIFFGLFASTMFMLIVRGIVYTIRVADIGLFICVILLILQLVSSGGTFPVSMQPGFFKVLHKILPFTYTVNAIREIYWDTDALVVLKDVGILLIIPSIFTITSLVSGYIWDKKTKYVVDGKTFYRSMDKNVGSL